MKDLKHRYGSRAMITGAAAGIGEAFAYSLAKRGFDLTLVDIDERALDRVAAGAREHGVSTRTIVADLTNASDLATIEHALADVGLLVANAGISHLGAFVDTPLEAHERALALNCRATLRLVHGAAAHMTTRGRGAIAMLSSNSGVLHSPFVAHYAATKAYVLALGEALHEELRPRGVDVLVVVPGLTRTPGLRASGLDEQAAGALIVDPDVVADGALARLGDAARYVPNPRDRLGAAILGALPRRTALALNARTMKRFFPTLRDK